MSARLLYVTVGSAEEAGEIGKSLVEDRLVACVNILSPMQSIYRWEGEIQMDMECVLIAKTREDLVDEVTARICRLHSYDVPCVVALPLDGGNPAFLDWIVEETGNPLPTVA